MLRPLPSLASPFSASKGAGRQSASLTRGLLCIKGSNVDQDRRCISSVGATHGQKAQLAEDTRDEVIIGLID